MSDLPSSTEHPMMLGPYEEVELFSAGQAASGAGPAFFMHFRTLRKKGKQSAVAGY